MDTRAEAAEVIKGQLLALEGVDEGVLDGCKALQYLPSTLEDGEMPEALLAGRFDECVVATDRRLILARSTGFGDVKTEAFPYGDLQEVKYDLLSFGVVMITVVLRDGGTEKLSLKEEPPGIDTFLEHLNTKSPVRRMQTEEERSERKRASVRAEQRQRKGPVKCRKCRGEQLSTQPKGLDWGKALVGGVLTLPVFCVGALFGFWGYGKTIVTCVGCGHAWYAGQR